MYERREKNTMEKRKEKKTERTETRIENRT